MVVECMRKKVMFMIWALEVGGAERLLVKLAEYISRGDYDVSVVCISREGVWASDLKQTDVKVICTHKKTGFDPSILFKLIEIIKSEKPDIVNTYLWTADLWGRLAAILAGVKYIVVTEQNVDVWKRWYHKLLDRILFKWTDYAICVSDEVVNFYHNDFNLPLNKLVMIPNAIDISLFDKEIDRTKERKKLGVALDDFVFVCAARLHPQKAHHILINAVSYMVKSGNKGFKVLLVGEGDLRQQFEEMVHSLKLESYIHFLGLRQDIPDILLVSDSFVLSSDYEGLSLAILEAMAARLPVVATTVGGNSQIIKEGKTGLLVPPQDSTSLAQAMSSLLIDKSLAQSMGTTGRSVVEQTYHISSVTKQTVALFDNCLVSH
jgi:glycosyltransferase involved in cell wall biosynthesis